MKEILELLSSAERLVSEAESNIEKIKDGTDLLQLERVLLLSKRCNDVTRSIQESKERILRTIIQIIVTVKSIVSIRVGDPERVYIVCNSRSPDFESLDKKIAFTTRSGHLIEVSISDFASKKYDDPDFEAFCLAVVNEAVKFLTESSEENKKEVGELKKLLEELNSISSKLELVG